MEEYNLKRTSQLTIPLELDLVYFILNRLMSNSLDVGVTEYLNYLSTKHGPSIRTLYCYIDKIKSIPFMKSLANYDFSNRCVCEQQQSMFGINFLDTTEQSVISDVLVCATSQAHPNISSSFSFNIHNIDNIDNIDNMNTYNSINVNPTNIEINTTTTMSDELIFTPSTTAQLIYDLQSIENPPSPTYLNNFDFDHSHENWNDQTFNESDVVVVDQADHQLVEVVQLNLNSPSLVITSSSDFDHRNDPISILDDEQDVLPSIPQEVAEVVELIETVQHEPIQDQVLVVVQPSTTTSIVKLKKRIISRDFDSSRKLKKRRFLWRPLTNSGSCFFRPPISR